MFSTASEPTGRRRPVLEGVKKCPAVEDLSSGQPDGADNNGDGFMEKASVNRWLKNLAWLVPLLGVIWWAHMAGTHPKERIAAVDNSSDTDVANAEFGVLRKEPAGEIPATQSAATSEFEIMGKLIEMIQNASDDELVKLIQNLKRNGENDLLVELKNLAEQILNSLDKIRELSNIIEKQAFHGVDYASDGRVVRHSEPYLNGLGGASSSISGLHSSADKILTATSRMPEDCFQLKGTTGFVVIRLPTPVIPKAVTLEHLAEGKLYDRLSAPKRCRVWGWHHKTEFLLTEFTYNLWKSNVQTFNVSDAAASAIVDTVRLDFTSNYGCSQYTRICRFRLHGCEPNSALH